MTSTHASRAFRLDDDSRLNDSRAAIEEQNWKLLYYLDLYRLTLAGLASAVALFSIKVPPFGEKDPLLFLIAALVYFGVALAAIGFARMRQVGFENQATALAFADVAAITVMMHASGGMDSGLALLLIISVAAAALMLNKRMTVLFAALATIALLVEHNWAFLTGGPWIVEGYSQTGLLGLALFGTATLGYTLAERLRLTEALAEQRGVDLANLAQVNELIIQNMQSGVIVCDRVGHVRRINKIARRFLGLNSGIGVQPLLTDLSSDLAQQLFRWLENRDNRSRQLIRSRSGYTLLPRFVLVGRETDGALLIFLEDTGILRQQAQQLKMAALARLTASIAHEIRNPLGAISNAAQLLAEASVGTNEDKRLVRIIEDQSQRMNVIVENVMQLSRRDHVEPRRTQLETWAAEFAVSYCDQIRLPRAAIQLQATKGVVVYVDSDQLYQVISNLCQNALRHSPPFKDRPIIQLRVGLDEETRPFIDCLDWGTGVSPEIVDNIFDPFFTTTPKGTGLGLYIARELCEGNGARLDYHAGDGGIGSRFRVTFSKADD